MNEVAQKYATALFSIALEENKVLDYQIEMNELKTLLVDDDEFLKLLKCASLTIDKRTEIIDKTLIGVNLNIVGLIKVLLKNHHISQLDYVFKEFNSLCNCHFGILEGIVYSIKTLDDSVIKQLENALSKKEAQKVSLINKIDPSLIGGIKITIANHIYDGSIKNKIDKMKLKITKGGTNYEN